MKSNTLFLAVIFMSTAAASQSVRPVGQVPANAKPLALQVVGRVEKTKSAQAGEEYRHEWPGVYFEGRFKGPDVYLAFHDVTNGYRVWIDGTHPLEIAAAGDRSYVISGLGAAEHLIRVEKVTESINTPETFDGMFVPVGGEVLPPPKPRRRAIEFVGDSGMTGYGILSPTHTCSKDEVHRLTDTQRAYPALVARHFDADYQINAISGRGIIRNYEGTSPGYAMSDLYPFTFFDKTTPYRDPKWKPQIVVFSLGGNDVSGDLKSNESWKTTDQLLDAMFAAYSQLIINVHRRYPKASLLVEWGYVLNDPHYQAVFNSGRTSIAKRAREAGIRKLFFVVPPADMNVDTSACDYHASIVGHRTVAAWFTHWLDAHPQLWEAVPHKTDAGTNPESTNQSAAASDPRSLP